MKSLSDDIIAAYAETLQSLGLLQDRDGRLEFANKVVDLTTSSQLLDMFCLFVIQSQVLIIFLKTDLLHTLAGFRLRMSQLWNDI